VQITGHDYLSSLGIELVPTSAPDFFTTDSPTPYSCGKCWGRLANLRRQTWLQN
jgi:hypothetical protein